MVRLKHFTKHAAPRSMLFASALLLPLRAAWAQDEPAHFDIDALPAHLALLELAQQAEASILFPGGVFTHLKTNPVHGRYELKEALRLMLEGTGIVATLVPNTNQILVRTDNKNEAQGGENTMMADNRRTRTRLATAMAAA